MNEWLQKQMDAGFADFEGLSITGRIPIKDRLVNELLQEVLKTAATGPDASTVARGPDLRPLLNFIEKAEVQSAEGVIVLNVSIRI